MPDLDRHPVQQSDSKAFTLWFKSHLLSLGLSFFVSFFTVGVANAGSISLKMTAAARVQGEDLVVDLTLENSGDEPARSISAVLLYGDKEAPSNVRPQLDSEDVFNTPLTLPVGKMGNGRWPYRIEVSYADTNGFPFHALLVGLVEIGAPPPADIAIPGFSPPPIADSGSLRVPIRNISATPQGVRVTLYLPKGLEASEPHRSVDLGPWETREIDFSIINRAGLAGSTYGIFLGAEYEDGTFHQAVITPASLEIAPEQQLLSRRSRPLMWLLGGLLLLGWAFYVVLRRSRK